jgi:uncharacterized protein (TIGR02246 family)
MKKSIFAFCLAIGALSSSAQTEDETAIRRVMDAQVKAWNNGDIDSFMQTYWQSDSLLFVGHDGPSYGWQATLEHYKEAYPDTAAMGKLSFNLLQLRPLSGEYYFVLGGWHLNRTVGDAGGYFTLIFRKINGRWLIIADHSS